MPTTALDNQFQALDINSENEPQEFADGLPKGSKQKNIERCIRLLEHTGSCLDLKFCREGGGCRRTKQVLYHHRNCPKNRKGVECSVCRQLVALCHIHDKQCKNDELGCYVPYCRNEKLQLKVKHHPNKTKYSSLEPTSDAYRQVLGKLLKALHIASADMKYKILQLFHKNPKTTATLLNYLCKVKLSKHDQNQRGTQKQVVFQTPCQMKASPNQVVQSSMESTVKPISWCANISVIPI